MQHAIGGFGKKAGDPPDIYHSYLGLAALSVMGDSDLKPINATACFSIDACKHIESLPWRKKIWSEPESDVAKPADLKGDVKVDTSYIAMTGG